MRSLFITSLLILAASGLTAPGALADESAEPAAEIEHLLRAIGSSECVFTRNGKRHSATEAEDHLRMKYGRTRARIRTAEAFIDQLASRSSWTGQAYSISCPGEETEPSRQWLYRELDEYRQA